jgi:hypothetical protein
MIRKCLIFLALILVPVAGDLLAGMGANTANKLQRWPSVASSLRFENVTCDRSLELAGLLRTIGFEDTLGGEHFATAWRLAASGRIGRFTIGVAGGDGVGDYIQGITASGVMGPSTLDTISGVGAFVGYRDIRRTVLGKPVSEINLAYGYSWMETPTILGAADKRFHQAWANYLRFFSEFMAIGFEYQYGYRLAASGDRGENHRLLMLIALKTGPTEQSTRVARGPSREAQEFMINGRTVEDVVGQDQLGGPAYSQQF